MRRRDVIKGLISLPLASLVKLAWAAETASQTVPAPTKLVFILEGPFVTVLTPSRVRVFTPMDNPFKRHIFCLNDTQYKDTRADQLHDMTFVGEEALQPNSVLPSTSDPCFNGFNYTSSRGPTNDDDLIQLSLPLPDRIYCAPGHSTPVKFESGMTTTTPSGHVLEYTLTDPIKPLKLTDSIMHDQPSGVDLRFPGAKVFGLQVGLTPAKPDPDKGGFHAIHFHNNVLLPRFPPIALDSDKRLSVVADIEKDIDARKSGIGFQLTSSAVECKIGGFVVTTP